MNIFQKRSLKKQIHHMLHEARHARHMREDIAPEKDIQNLKDAETNLVQIWKGRKYDELEQGMQLLSDAIGAVYPTPSHPRFREFIEILAVALIVAWGLRTYFIQPFKIPTGSMQPTLYGITVEPQLNRGLLDHFPLSTIKYLLTGDKYIEFRSQYTGRVHGITRSKKDGIFYVDIGGNLQKLPNHELKLGISKGQQVSKGQILGGGLQKAGDHIFVDKVRYNFTRPKRGQIFVFNTDGIKHPGIKKDTFYIKRLAGVPGDEISIDPPHLLNHGEILTEPEGFRRVAENFKNGYDGYHLAESVPSAKLKAPQNSIVVKSGEFLPLGDNSGNSLDGKYFGTVRQENVVGPAFSIYWPFTRRWGLVN